MTRSPKINFIGFPYNYGGNLYGSCLGARLIFDLYKKYVEFSNKNSWRNISDFTNGSLYNQIDDIISVQCNKLAQATYRSVRNKDTFVVLGGDHSCAIGTWSGASAAMGKNAMGLIWIDAHMDAHTPETSPSNNIHGMPLASLLGYGPNKFTQIISKDAKFNPHNICLIGVRSYEAEEKKLLQSLGVKIFYMHEFKSRSAESIFNEALKIVTKKTKKFGISLDIDVISRREAPGVSLPVNCGMHMAELMSFIKILKNDTRLLGVELVEFNPLFDKKNKTQNIMCKILEEFTYILKQNRF